MNLMNLNLLIKNLPHRYPFRMIDTLVVLDPGKMAKAIKRISNDELFLKGNLKDYPLFPAILIIEALAQTGGIALLADKEEETPSAYLVRIDDIKFLKTIMVGDTLLLEAKIQKVFGKLAKVEVKAEREDEIVALGYLVLGF
ncbi:MAG: 3-hydroxyacyl-[acyl-carrier-protein] dehydratase FabZ [Spirochaetes bacterium]|nr:MAG: 3-hydroxyacyl-[acyl-carrier-protein] dehydratase FabZ [Spirochaetota bacterium]RLA90656.1 MAG: 3-hydroxyacyl-[acyl-carrier-protein] dehydratase FabZ [Deltaproteobacteria bacterium]